MQPGRRADAAWAAAAAAAGVLLAFAPAVVGLRTLSHRDTAQLYAPVRTLVVEELRSGRLPLWNPYEALGVPLFAEGVHSVLHPISLAAAALAPASIDALILAYLVGASLGTFTLARSLRATPPAAAGAGLALALSGFTASMTGNLVFLAGLSTLPWIVAAARSAGAGSRFGPLWTALATGCGFLGGDVQATAVGVALGLALAADAGGGRGAARALAGVFTGVLLGGVQIETTRALLPLTYRSLELPDDQRLLWALDPGRLLEWVVPGLFRGPLAEVPRGASGATLAPRFAESVHLGAPLLVAAAYGARRGGRRAAVLLAAAGVLLWLALGHHLGARQLLDGVPIWSRFRYSEKLMGPLALCACALAALGIDALAAGRLSPRWRRGLASTAAAAAAALAALLLAPAATADLAAAVLGDAGPFYRARLVAGLPHLATGLAVLLALDRLRAPPARRAAALSGLVAAAAAAALPYAVHLGTPGAGLPAGALRLESDGPAPRLVHPDRQTHAEEGQDVVESTSRADARILQPAVNVAARVESVELHGPFEPLRVATLARAFGEGWPQLFRRFAATHVVLARGGGAAFAVAVHGAERAAAGVPGVELWPVPHRRWAFFAEAAVAARDAAGARSALYDLAARGDEGTVVVEAPEPPPTAPGRVLRVARGPRTLEVEAESDGPALLVVQDAFWPGWRGEIDGVGAEVLAADALVRAVRWPGGRHRLTMTYDPPELRTGLALTAVGGALALLLAALAVKRGHPPVR